jgi:uncharacterized protein (TIGR00290 family)
MSIMWGFMKVWMSWSSGKDSAFALYKLKQQGISVDALFTTINESANRVAMHAVRETLLANQAEALNLPLYKISIPSPCSNQVYESRMGDFIEVAKQEGVTHFAFGDLFLEDVRLYRINQLQNTGIEPLFPLWGSPTGELAREMIKIGQKTIVTCIDPKKLSTSFAGRDFNDAFLNDLPSDIDPCGERGEFHTFVYDSPLFKAPIPIVLGEIIERDGFVFADVR